MSRWGRRIGFAALAVVALLTSYPLRDVANKSIQYELTAIGSSVYEYHARTGRWPARAEDLLDTSLPEKARYAVSGIRAGQCVVLWHPDLKPDPRDNADRILAYHDAGMVSWFGRVWVCWGDLRTEYVRRDVVKARLQAGRE